MNFTISIGLDLQIRNLKVEHNPFAKAFQETMERFVVMTFIIKLDFNE